MFRQLPDQLEHALEQRSTAAITAQNIVSQASANTVAISSVTSGGLQYPVNLGAVSGQIDVTLFVSGPGGTLELIQNCTANGAISSVGDVVVATQQVAGSQKQLPVTLSYNTAATGSIINGAAVPSALSNTPLHLNGPCVLKASLGKATAINAMLLNLVNTSFYRVTLAFSGPTLVGNDGLAYASGDATVTITPVDFSSTPLAFISGTFAGRPFTNVAPKAGTQTFVIRFPNSSAPIDALARAMSIGEYTSPPTGDFLLITASITVAGQPGFAAHVPSAGPFRIDNQVHAAPPTTSW